MGYVIFTIQRRMEIAHQVHGRGNELILWKRGM